MPQIKVGLASRDGSFYDPKTNAYITPSKPVDTISYDANTDLSNIAHAVFAQTPALILLEGKLPQATIDKWKAIYNRGIKQALDRTDAIQAASPATVTGTASHASGAAKDAHAPITAQSEEASEVLTSDQLSGEGALLENELLLSTESAENETKKTRSSSKK